MSERPNQSQPRGHDTFRNVLIAGAVFAAMMAIGPALFPTRPPAAPSAPTGSATAPTDQGPFDEAGKPSSAGAGPTGSAAGVAETAAALTVVEAAEERTTVIGSAAASFTPELAARDPFRMSLTVSNVGAAIESATMTDHAEQLHKPDRYRLLAPITGSDGRTFRSLNVEKINVDGVDVLLGDKRWNGGMSSETETGQSIGFDVVVQRGAAPLLRVTRTFTLPRQPVSARRHDLQSSIAMENLSSEPHRIIATFRGGMRIPMATPGRDDRVISWGLSSGGRVAGSTRAYGDIAKYGAAGFPLFTHSKADPNSQLSWAATANTYFTCTIAPLGRTETSPAPFIADVSAIDLDGSAATVDDTTLRFVSIAESLAPGGKPLEYPIEIYLGEKDGDAFRAVPDYQARKYYYQVVQSYGSCTFTWLVELMVWLLNALVWVVRDYGVAIIILVLIVRALLHPITKKGQVNMVRMQTRMGEFQPKLEELKKRYANDKVRFQQETMKLYREHGINPATQMLGCLPMVIQMPIWVALWISLSNNIQMRHEPFLFTWIRDLTAPDALYTFSSPIVVPLFGWELPSFNLLPILLSIFMYLQQKWQPKPPPNPNMTDQQRQQQEMMQMMMPMMSIMMLLIFYKAPSGLTLYVMASSIFGIIEQKWIREHIDRYVRVDTGKAPVPSGSPKPPAGPHRPTWIERLQRMADDARKLQSQRPVKGKPRR